MAKRARFIAPVEVLQGNLSGKQDLKYPSNDNKAYEAPAGVNYASNYTTRYIGAYRAKDGLKYFAVKKRSAVKISASTKLNMALLGATQAIFANIMTDNSMKLKLGASYNLATQQGQTSLSLANWAKEIIRRALLSKTQYISFLPQTGAGVGVATNPFNAPASPSAGTHVTSIKNSVLLEFWGALAVNGIYFFVGGRKCIAHSGDTFTDAMNQQDALNPGLNLKDAQGMVAFGEQVDEHTVRGYRLLDGDTNVESVDVIGAKKYSLGEYGEYSDI